MLLELPGFGGMGKAGLCLITKLPFAGKGSDAAFITITKNIFIHFPST